MTGESSVTLLEHVTFHTDVHGICIPGYIKPVGEIAAELTLCAPSVRAMHGGEPGAQMVQ